MLILPKPLYILCLAIPATTYAVTAFSSQNEAPYPISGPMTVIADTKLIQQNPLRRIQHTDRITLAQNNTKEQSDTSKQKMDADALVALAHQYRKGTGVKQSTSKAFELYQQAAAQGHPGAELWLGVLYWGSIRAPNNIPEAKKWLDRSAAQGYTEATKFIVTLANSYRTGKWKETKITQDKKLAFELYQLAAQHKEPEAEFQLAMLYWEGEITPKNIPEAKAWLKRSAQQGYPAAIKIMETSKGNLE